jgi:hypothetical protein
MGSEQVQGLLFQTAGFGMLLHLACSAALRASVREDPALREALFGSPLLGSAASYQWFLRGKYFFLWFPAPHGLEVTPPLTRSLFWVARLGAMLVVLGFVSFLVAIFWQIGHA